MTAKRTLSFCFTLVTRVRKAARKSFNLFAQRERRAGAKATSIARFYYYYYYYYYYYLLVLTTTNTTIVYQYRCY